jgi:hypothetical protein
MLSDVSASEVPPSTQMDRNLHVPIPQKAIIPPSKLYIFSTIYRRAGTLDFKSQGGVQPSHTSAHSNHHSSSFYKLHSCRFSGAFCQPSIFLAQFLINQDAIMHPLLLPIFPLFYRRNHQGIRISQDLSPATQFFPSHAPCTRMFLDHTGHLYHSIRSQLTLQDVS